MSTPAITFDTSHAVSPRRAPSPDSLSSSRGVSLDLPQPSPGLRSPRRNRSALRQFYGLQPSAEGGEVQGRGKEEEELGELDREGFEVGAYVEKLMETAELKELLRVENELVNEIRGFDGERKALVYDNYSKLITATDTIRKMRANMEPLAPTTSTLGPAIAHIARVSESLTQTIPPSPIAFTSTEFNESNRKKKETVAWALSSPERIEALVKEGNREEAEREWGVLEALLRKWKGVKGVEELQEKAQRALDTEKAEISFE